MRLSFLLFRVFMPIKVNAGNPLFLLSRALDNTLLIWYIKFRNIFFASTAGSTGGGGKFNSSQTN